MHALAQSTATARHPVQVRQAPTLQSVSLHEADEAGSDQDISIAAILSSDLLRGQKTVSIRHNGSVYRLQATRLGKLILTK